MLFQEVIPALLPALPCWIFFLLFLLLEVLPECSGCSHQKILWNYPSKKWMTPSEKTPLICKILPLEEDFLTRGYIYPFSKLTRLISQKKTFFCVPCARNPHNKKKNFRF